MLCDDAVRSGREEALSCLYRLLPMMDPVWSASSVIIQVLAFIVILPFENNEKEPLTRLGVYTAQAEK